jgi:hypothetical protein
MVVRVDREIFDPVGVGSTSGSVGMVYEDAVRPNPWEPRPFTTKSEYIVSEALRLMEVPAEVIRNLRPPVPIELFPPQLGYGPDQQLTISDVLQTDRWTPTIRSWTSGTPRVPRRVDTEQDMWSGTLRNFQSSPNMMG